MAKKLSVFCALPSERNTGMATVDLAAMTRLQALVPDTKITLYAYGSAGPYTYQHGELPYYHLNVMEHAEQFFSADAWLFWGDFIHTHAYFQKDRTLWDENVVRAENNLAQVDTKRFADYAKFAFLADASTEMRRRSIVFGGTLITNHAENSLDAPYWQAYSQLFGEAKAVLLRDAISAAAVSPLRSDESTQGCDCAFLLSNSDLAELTGFKQAEKRSGVGAFFGRSPHRLTMMRFAKRMASALGQEVHWLPWFRTRRKSRIVAGLLGHEIPAGEFTPGDLLSRLSGFQFVVTDTYHVCVNAWRMGIPAVCVGLGAQSADSSLSDKKKEVLYQMLGAQQFYVFAELLKLDFEHQLRSVIATLQSAAIAEAVHTNVKMQRDAAQSRLKHALDGVLA